MKSGTFGFLGAGVAIVAFIVFYSSAFVVDPKWQALVLQFGEVRGTVTEPGLSFKRPFIENVEYLPKLILDLEQGPQEIIASDQKRLIVSAFARYRISDPAQFYRTVRTVQAGDQRLQTFMSSTLRAILADAPFSAIVRDARAELMNRIKVEVSKRAHELGIEVVDVRIRRADLPTQNGRAIFERMKTERQREAIEIRAKGSAESQRIIARAEADRVIIMAEATRDANRVSGEGEATRAQIFADAYGRDQEFFAFYRSLQAYEAAFKAGDGKTGETRLVISPTSDFFRYFSNSKVAPLALPRAATNLPDSGQAIGPASPSAAAPTPGSAATSVQVTPTPQTGVTATPAPQTGPAAAAPAPAQAPATPAPVTPAPAAPAP
ncbi:MAG: protease modulator HflC [Ancalomicrobiaceae bacterium]|nr:protease modulator HflC [Ancalomicrobiaceae bacterium]